MITTGGFKFNPALMLFDLLFQVMYIDQLNVKLIVEMFYSLKLVFGEGFPANFLERFFG